MKKLNQILIVDDDDMSRYIACFMLEDEGITPANIITVKNGEEAVGWIENKTELPDLIFLDLNMALLSGWEFLEYLTIQGLEQKVKVVIYSTSIMGDIRPSADHPSVIGVLHKPLERERLQSILASIK